MGVPRINSFIVISLFALMCLVSFPIAGTVLAQQRQAAPKYLFAPFASLTYGPNTALQSITLTFRNAIIYEPNSTLNVNVPNGGTLDPLPFAHRVPAGSVVGVIFDSYNIFNRLTPQVLPTIGNVSVSLTPIKDAQQERHYTQMILGNSTSLTPLPSLNGNPPTKYFTVPSNIHVGSLYLVSASVYFPDYKVAATYANTACVVSSATVNATCS